MKYIISLAFLSIYYVSVGQTLDMQLIGSVGGHYTLTNGTEYSWSVGEVVTETYQQTNNTLTQGFHQPFILNLSSVADKTDLDASVVFPIPADQLIQIQFDQLADRTLQIESLLGQILLIQRASQTVYQFQIADLPAAGYIIRQINHTNQSINISTFTKY